MKYFKIGTLVIACVAIGGWLLMQTNWHKNKRVSSNIEGLQEIKIAQFETDLPETMPADITIHYSDHGGMTMYADSFHITPKEQTFTYLREEMEFNEEGLRQRSIDMQLSYKEIEALYMQLRRYGFDKIESKDHEEPVYDGGGTRIYLSYSEGTKEFNFDVSSGESGYVVEEYRPHWELSTQLFTDMVAIYNK